MINQRSFIVVVLALLALTGCKGITTRGEREARQQAGRSKRPTGPTAGAPALPDLTTNSSLGDFLTCAMLNQPQIEAAYYDWAASVENITVARSLPDPQFTFQLYIQDVITSVMPGLMAQIPWPGKLRAQAEAATAESRAKYFAFEGVVLQTAYDVKQGYYQLWFLDKKIAVDREMLQLLSELERIARAQNETGQATLQDVYRAQIEADRLKTEIVNLEDSRHSLDAQFKAALGLARNQPDPPLPARFEATTLDLSPEQLLDTAFARNPQLKAMEAEVRQAQASLDLARKVEAARCHHRLLGGCEGHALVVLAAGDGHAAHLARQDRRRNRRRPGRPARGAGAAYRRADQTDRGFCGKKLCLSRSQPQPRPAARTVDSQGATVTGNRPLGVSLRQNGFLQPDGRRTFPAGIPAVGNRGAHPARTHAVRIVAAHRRRAAGQCAAAAGGRSQNKFNPYSP